MPADRSAPSPPAAPSSPGRAAVLSLIAALGALALVVAGAATLIVGNASSRIPGSLVFSAILLVAAVLSRYALPVGVRDHGVAVAAAASLGAVPFIAFCCDHALTVPTWDARPLEGLGPFVLAAIGLFLLLVGPITAFVISIPLGLWANAGTRVVMRFLAGVAIAGALALTITAAARRARFPEPDGYVPSLPVIAKTDGDACPIAPCVRCPAGDGPRTFTLLSPAGTSDLGPIEAPCEKLEFRRDPGRALVLVSGDVDRGATRQAWPAVMVYDEATGRAGSRHLSELRDTLAPPLAWVLEAGLGVLLAITILLVGILRRRQEASATAQAAEALAAAVLFATPLAMAWSAGLFTLR